MCANHFSGLMKKPLLATHHATKSLSVPTFWQDCFVKLD